MMNNCLMWILLGVSIVAIAIFSEKFSNHLPSIRRESRENIAIEPVHDESSIAKKITSMLTI